MAEIKSLFKKIVPPANNEAIQDWLAEQMGTDNPYLLAHADDGVIWGRKTGDQFLTSHKIAPDISPQLRGLTLWQAFVFGEDSEIRLFRDETGDWKAVEIFDAATEDMIVEDQILWGDNVVKQGDGFTHIRDRVKQCMDHVPPIDISETDINKKNIFPRLRIHHMIEYSQETGEARIGLSRLVKIGIW